MAYAHVQMILYRPFLHYVSYSCQSRNVDKRSYACAAAGVSISRNVIHITAEMKRRGLLIGAYWFTMYTTFFAILALVFFILENPESVTTQDILKDAMEGKEILASLAKRSMAADRCTITLQVSPVVSSERAFCAHSCFIDTLRPLARKAETWSFAACDRSKETPCTIASPDTQGAWQPQFTEHSLHTD